MVDRLSLILLVCLLNFAVVTPKIVFGRDSDAIEFTKDSLDTVKKNIAEGKAVLVDVRELIEWNSGHVRKAIFLPWRELQSNKGDQLALDKLPRNKIIYTYCAVGYRSSRAGKILAKHQFDVRPLKPGFEELAKAGFETEKL